MLVSLTQEGSRGDAHCELLLLCLNGRGLIVDNKWKNSLTSGSGGGGCSYNNRSDNKTLLTYEPWKSRYRLIYVNTGVFRLRLRNVVMKAL